MNESGEVGGPLRGDMVVRLNKRNRGGHEFCSMLIPATRRQARLVRPLTSFVQHDLHQSVVLRLALRKAELLECLTYDLRDDGVRGHVDDRVFDGHSRAQPRGVHANGPLVIVLFSVERKLEITRWIWRVAPFPSSPLWDGFHFYFISFFLFFLIFKIS